jgi:hypothetical protein
MQNIALIINGVVVNIALWDGISLWQPQCDSIVDITNQPQVQIGWTYDGANFNAPIGD